MGKAEQNIDIRIQQAIEIFEGHSGIMRTSDAIRAGIHPGVLYAMRDSGVLERISRGVYRITGGPEITNPDLVTIAMRIPKGVVCLISALSFHDLTTQIPHRIDIALSRGAEEPRLDHPPIKTYRFGGRTFLEGIEIHEIDKVPVRVYSAEKTLVDCFRFRNRIGMDTVLEALRLYTERNEVKTADILYYAGICRVKRIMMPYLEAMLG